MRVYRYSHLLFQISFSFGLIRTSLGNILQSCDKKRNIGPSSLDLIGLPMGTATPPSFMSQLLFEDTRIRYGALKTPWESGQQTRMELKISFFQYIKNCSRQGCLLLTPTDLDNFPCCFFSEEEKVCLSAPVTEEEIKQGLWSLKPFKAPGVDGLHAGFFQYFWADVKGSVCREVMGVFESK